MNIEEAIKIVKKIRQDYNLYYPMDRKEVEAVETLLTAYEKQNKIIDLMARDLKTPVNSKEWIIEYYKKRCEDAKD